VLTKKRHALVDRDDLDRVSEHVWFVGVDGYAHTKRQGKPIKMQQMILGKKRGFWIDHVNRNRLDNRRSNLRFVRPAKNGWNRSRGSDNSSGFKGVHRVANPGRPWVARIGVRGKRKYLGVFTTAEAAARAYDAAARKYFGQYASPNYGKPKSV
jgi:hypothetical protein